MNPNPNQKNCSLCGGRANLLFTKKFLNKYHGDLYQCSHCLYTFVSNPGWIQESYSDAIAGSDLGLLQRNIDIARKLSVLLHFFFDTKKLNQKQKHLDFGGGYGVLVRLMRDLGFESFWYDEYCQNIFSKDFTYELIKEELRKIDTIWAFEVIEHLENPRQKIEEILKKFNGQTFIFTQETFTDQSPKEDWWYLAKETGQHLSFFHLKTLNILAKELSLNYYHCGNFHILTKKKINEFLLKFLLGPFSYFFFIWIKKKRASLLPSDVDFYFKRHHL